MNYLVAVDLEGISGVVGTEYETLTHSSDYEVAKVNAIKEINAAVCGLFDGGAENVYVWDNHGGKKNLDDSLIDPRAQVVERKKYNNRMDFVIGNDVSGILYIGYHSREGSPNGVLAHTYSSNSIQYVKVNGRAVGELDVDSWIAGEHGIAPLFVSSDDVCVGQALPISSDIITVITKYGKGRNSADLRNIEDVLVEIYEGAKASAAKKNAALSILECPAKVEIRYTRAESAAKIYNRVSQGNAIPVEYGEDSHILHFTVNSAKEIPHLLH